MKVFLLFFVITQAISKPSFDAYFDKNGITLDDIYIKYNSYYETNVNNISAIQFDTISSDNNDNYTFVLTSLYNHNIYIETTNIFYKSNNTLKVILLIMEHEFQNTKNELILNLSFNKIFYGLNILTSPLGPINFNGKYYLEVGKFNIIFSKKVLIDNEYHMANLDRFGNHFYLNFPSFKEYIIYDFTIFENNINI
jgi:hypothetical protein